MISNVNVAVCVQVNNENCSLPVAVRVSKLRVLKFPIVWGKGGKATHFETENSTFFKVRFKHTQN